MNIELGTLIRRKRKSLGKALTDVAEQVGINKGTLSRLERGHSREIKVGNVIPLARALRLHPMDILNACTKEKERWNGNE